MLVSCKPCPCWTDLARVGRPGRRMVPASILNWLLWPRARNTTSLKAWTHSSQQWWPRPASCWPGCWRGPTGWWCPPRRGPAGTGRRWCSPDSGSGPQGSAPPWWPGYLWVSMLDVWEAFVIWWSHLTETPAWADRITLSDPITVSRPELENSVFLLESVTTILSAVTRNPALSE